MADVLAVRPHALWRRSIVVTLVLTLGLGELPALAAQDAQAAPAQASGPVDTSPETLDHLLAPIALYPDALLMQVLAASVDSQEVLDGGNWLLENKSLDGTALDAAAKKAGFGAAMTALFHFPDVVDQMCTQLDWTRQVGAAFNADQAAVLASIQRLRAQAVQYGNLKSSPQQQVVTQQENGKQVIVIQPANPQVVYVPQYNPETVYVQSSGPSTGDVVAASIISFGVGMAVGSLFASNNYYYPRWGYGGVYYGGRPWVPAHYAYRPVYGPHWGPSYGYRPPANYPYHRPNYNNNYYNRYRGGNNYNGNRPGNGNGGYNKPGNGNNNRPGNGNGGYNKPGNGNTGNNNRPGNGNGGYNKPGNGNGGNNNRPGNGGGNNNRPGAGNNGGYNKPGGGNNGPNRPGNSNNATRPAPDRGYTRPAASPAPQQPRPGGSGARPGAPQQRPNNAARPPQTRPASPPTRQAPAFSPGGGGRSTNAASQRGAASNSRRTK